MMQMLEAGGIPILTDDKRTADEDNPKGYYEYDPVKRLHQDTSWLAQAAGKAVKVVSPLLTDLPSGYEYHIIVMHRNLAEVLNSQEQMLKRRGAPPGPDQSIMRQHLERSLNNTRQWLSKQQHMQVLECHFARLLEQPQIEIPIIADFLQFDLDQAAMKNVIQPSLYRQR